MEILFYNNSLFILLYLIIIYIAALICTTIFFIRNILLHRDFIEILKINMIVKIIQIPAYIVLFLLGMLFLITIFTMGISVVLLVFNGMAIFLTGLIGLSGIIRCFFEKKLSLKNTVMYAIFQFIFVIDVIFCIIIYRKMRGQNGKRNQISS